MGKIYGLLASFAILCGCNQSATYRWASPTTTLMVLLPENVTSVALQDSHGYTVAKLKKGHPCERQGLLGLCVEEGNTYLMVPKNRAIQLTGVGITDVSQTYRTATNNRNGTVGDESWVCGHNVEDLIAFCDGPVTLALTLGYGDPLSTSPIWIGAAQGRGSVAISAESWSGNNSNRRPEDVLFVASAKTTQFDHESDPLLDRTELLECSPTIIVDWTWGELPIGHPVSAQGSIELETIDEYVQLVTVSRRPEETRRRLWSVSKTDSRNWCLHSAKQQSESGDLIQQQKGWWASAPNVGDTFKPYEERFLLDARDIGAPGIFPDYACGQSWHLEGYFDGTVTCDVDAIPCGCAQQGQCFRFGKSQVLCPDSAYERPN